MGWSPTVSGSGGSSVTIPTKGYLYNGDVGLNNWREAYANLSAKRSGKINVVCLGDSITEGTSSDAQNSFDMMKNGYVGVLNDMFASQFSHLGYGLIPTYYPYATTNWPMWRFTGSGWQDYTTWGVASTGKKTSNNGDSCTFTFVGTGVTLFYLGTSDSGNINFTVDSNNYTGLSLNSATTKPILQWSQNGLAYGKHTMTVTASLTSGQSIYLLGALPTGSGNYGVQFHQMAKGGATSTSWLNDGNGGSNALQTSIDFWSPKLTIISFLSNDYDGQLSLSTYQSNLQTMITRAKNFGDVLLTSIGIRNVTGLATAQSSYVSTLQSLAQSNGIAYVDIFNRWGGDAANAHSMGYYDGVHPYYPGHRDIASAIYEALTGENKVELAPALNGVPVMGKYVQSDRVKNVNASAGGELGWVCTTAGSACGTAWATSTAYNLGDEVYNGTNVYVCTTAGTSAASGGPTGNGTGIVDNTAQWAYVNPLAVFKTYGAIST